MNNIHVRKATKEDMPAVLGLILELAEYEHGLNTVTMSVEELVRDGFGENPLFHCVVAEVDGKILGTAVYFFNYSTWNGKCLYLEDLVVTRKQRSKGVGSELMKEVIRIAKENKSKRLAWQVLDWNRDAWDFYKKFGATLEREWVNGRLNHEQLAALEV